MRTHVGTLALLMALGVVLAGCQDNSSLQADVAKLKAQVALLQDENQDLRNEAMRERKPAQDPEISTLIFRMKQAEMKLDETERALRELRTGAQEAPVLEVQPIPSTGDDDEFARFRAMQERLDAERRTRRNEQRAEQMQDWARVARENGLEFDPDNPQASIQRIMMDPTQRARAFEVMRNEMNNRRLGALGLDDFQMREVQRIESDTRQKIRETMTTARETGATQEEIARQVQNVRSEQEQELKRVLTPEQYEEYERTAAAGMIPQGFGGMGGMFPPGMFPGGG